MTHRCKHFYLETKRFELYSSNIKCDSSAYSVVGILGQSFKFIYCVNRKQRLGSVQVHFRLFKEMIRHVFFHRPSRTFLSSILINY